MNTQRSDCESFEAEVLWQWLDDVLSDIEKERWRRHLSECAHCRLLLRDTEHLVGARSGPDAPETALLRVIRAAESRRFHPGSRRLAVAQQVAGTLLVAAALVLVALSDDTGPLASLRVRVERSVTDPVMAQRRRAFTESVLSRKVADGHGVLTRAVHSLGMTDLKTRLAEDVTRIHGPEPTLR